MTTIEYEKNDLSERTLERLHRDIERVEPLKRFGRFKTWLHYANLKRWRDQGHHFHYLSEPNSIHCTCGLVVNRGDDGSYLRNVSAVGDIPRIKLDDVQWVKGHVNLPSGRGRTVALIYNFFYAEVVQNYLWDAFCQECGEVVQKKVLLEAKEFVKEHNKTCKRK
jgi:hypothetical protein